MCGYPDVDTLTSDMTFGFPVLGPMTRGPGWLPRLDGKYSHPISIENFKVLNFQHISSRLRHLKPDPHWQAMLTELLEEKRKGRLSGPLEFPAAWQVQTAVIEHRPTQPVPDEEVFIAFSFSVEQRDKIRRIEDWSASFHNSTIAAFDVPTHHSVTSFVHCIRRFAQHGVPCVAWGHDLDSAYRQLPIKHPKFCYVVLALPDGPSLWRHNSMSFGATASVWNFNRYADAVQFLARKMLITPAFHFVDDFAGFEPPSMADSGHRAFSEFFGILGIETKSTKAQPPAPQQRLLGVDLRVEPHAVVVAPCPDRVQKVLVLIDSVLQTNSLAPPLAQKLAGKINFLNTTMFGQCGSAALQPVYARAANLNPGGQRDFQLTDALTCALRCIQSILRNSKPKRIPFGMWPFTPVIYADAFFKMNQKLWSLQDPDIPTAWSKSAAPHMLNGWGIVCRVHCGTFFCGGQVPAEVMKPFCSRRAYIYFLEVVSQVLAIVIFHESIGPFWVSFIDNLPGKFALLKGYGRDPAINRLLAFAWAFITQVGGFPHFHYVASHCNVSDGISRGDFSLARKAGWTRLELNLEPFFDILLRVAKSLEYAFSDAVQDALTFSASLHVPRPCGGAAARAVAL